MVILVGSDVRCTVGFVLQYAVRAVVVKTTESTVVDSGVLFLISPHVHVNHPILHLSVLLHFVLEQFLLVQLIIHVHVGALFIVEEVVQFLTHDNGLRAVFLIPVDYQQVEAHTENAVDNLAAVEDLLDGIVVRKVVDLVLVLVALAVVLEDALEVAIVDHGHRSVTVRVPAVPVEPVHWVF